MTFSINLPRCKPKTIEIPVFINDSRVNGLLDTGSAENFISKGFVETSELMPVFLPIFQTTEIANGEMVEINEEINLSFKLENDKNNLYMSKLYVLHNPNKQAILGMRFLIENEAVINLKEGYISLDGSEYEIDVGIVENRIDNEIVAETKTYSLDEFKNNIFNLIRTVKKSNPVCGKIPNVYHKINLIGKFTLIKKEYPVPQSMYDSVKLHLNDLISHEIIQEKNTDFVSPAFVLRKSNGKLRLVVDYRHLNSITKKTNQFTPNMYELLGKLKGSKIYSTIDLNQGYYQIPISENDIEKTGFEILNRTYVFNRILFVLCNAPATFQRAMNSLFSNVKNSIVYLDDILVYTSNTEDHYKTLKEVFKIITNNNISVNFEKSNFLQNKISFLGHLIDENGIKPNISKIENIDLENVTTKRKLQRMLGILNWYIPFIKDISNKLSTIYGLLK
ncbi:Retrovirus-related Pol polyprotein from transposon 17.6 [Dictyocoela muelleri]|nr:Retrovirus-related Pol polyprotein from transposon 17.6 [Dictyocoela muelleri]